MKQSKAIDGLSVDVMPLPALEAMRVLIELAKVAGGGAKALNSAKSLSDILDSVQIGDIIDGILSRLEPEKSAALIMRLLQNTWIEAINVSTESNFNKAFAGKLVTLPKVLLFVLEVNYGDFFSAIGGHIGSQTDSENQAG